MEMNRMIFVTGFARGGTSWLRDCISSHPDIQNLESESVLIRGIKKKESILKRLLQWGEDNTTIIDGAKKFIENKVESAIFKKNIDAPFYIDKAPANAPYIGKACRFFPESKFIFIIRDPRDVFISHKRGAKEWMGGSNSRVEGCMKKIRKYYDGYFDAKEYSNIMLVKYEDLHQDFHATLAKVYRFIGVSNDAGLIEKAFKENNFLKVAGRRHLEDRDSPRRKGVVGDWVKYLSKKELRWYKKNKFWSDFMKTYGYTWRYPSFEKILRAMKEGGVKDLTEDDLLALRLDSTCPNVLLFHDVDSFKTKEARQSVLETARIEGKLRMASIFNFLPLDNLKYSALKLEEIIEIIHEVQALSPRAAIGLHFNATERFFPAKMEDVGDDHPDMPKAIAYLHEQVDTYARHGIKFRTATAHGYGRAKKHPNNRDSYIFSEELKKRGISLFDTTFRQLIDNEASNVAKFSDVGESLVVRYMPNNGAVDNPETYHNLPAKSLIRFLTHPGNYDINRALTLGIRINVNQSDRCVAPFSGLVSRPMDYKGF